MLIAGAMIPSSELLTVFIKDLKRIRIKALVSRPFPAHLPMPKDGFLSQPPRQMENSGGRKQTG